MAWIIPAIQAAYGMYQGQKAGQKADQSAKAQQGLIDQQIQQLKMLMPYQRTWLGSGAEDIARVNDYWRTLASGNVQARNQALSPEMSQIDRGYANQRQTQSEWAPRGSGLMDRLADDQFKQKLGLQINARPMAMGQLGNLGLQQANLGLGSANQVTSGFGNANQQQGGLTGLWGNLAGGYGSSVGRAFGEWTDYLKDYQLNGKRRA